MNTFRVIFKARSFSVLPYNVDTFKIELVRENKRGRIKVKNNDSVNLLGHSFSNELIFICETEADDLDDAIHLGGSEVNRILEILAFIIGAPVGEVRLFKAYDVTPDTESREYLQMYYDVLDKAGSRSIEAAHIDPLFGRLMQNTNSRIFRAIHWYRQSLADADPLDRFSHIWIGLETLNPIFQDMYPDALEVTACTNCGYQREFKGTSALKRYFLDVLNKESIYSKARNIRQGLQHGHRDIDTLISDSEEVIPDLAKALRTAICVATCIDPNNINYEVNLDEVDQIAVLLMVKLINLNVDEKTADYFEPNFDLKVDIYERDGSIVFHPEVTTNVLNNRVALGGIHWELYGETGYPIQKTAITLKG